MFDAARVKTWIPKKISAMIEIVDEDSEVVEVVLKDGFHHKNYEETAWIFGKARYEYQEYTLAEIKTDLRDWLNNVEKKPC